MAEAHRTLIRKLKEHSRLVHEDLAEINALSHTIKDLKPNEDLIRQGDDPNVSALVMSGMVARYHLLDDGRRHTSHFTWLAICPTPRRSSSIRWTMRCVVSDRRSSRRFHTRSYLQLSIGARL